MGVLRSELADPSFYHTGLLSSRRLAFKGVALDSWFKGPTQPSLHPSAQPCKLTLQPSQADQQEQAVDAENPGDDIHYFECMLIRDCTAQASDSSAPS